MKKADSVDAYLRMHPPVVRKRLAAIRALIRKAAPDAEEKISYGIPAYALEGRLLYFAAHTEHIGVYPVTAAVRRELGDKLAPYLSAKAKSTIRLPNDRPLPLALLTKVVKVRVRENKER
jgi:uncharacterized protein YdhG (YjbR/CyaY superfamily)